MQRVTRLDLKGCGLTEFPREIFAHADTLEFLDVSANQIASIPDDLGRLKNLRILFASGNPISHLPASLGDCGGLSTIGFRGCQMGSIEPGGIFALPGSDHSHGKSHPCLAGIDWGLPEVAQAHAHRKCFGGAAARPRLLWAT